MLYQCSLIVVVKIGSLNDIHYFIHIEGSDKKRLIKIINEAKDKTEINEFIARWICELTQEMMEKNKYIDIEKMTDAMIRTSYAYFISLFFKMMKTANKKINSSKIENALLKIGDARARFEFARLEETVNIEKLENVII